MIHPTPEVSSMCELAIDEIVAGIAGDSYDYSDDMDSSRDEAIYSDTKSYSKKIQAIINEQVQLARIDEVNWLRKN